MMLLRLISVLVVLGCVCAAPATNDENDVKNVAPRVKEADADDLNTAASSTHARRYSDYGYGVTGYGVVDQGYSGYNSLGYSGYSGYPGYSTYGGYKRYGGYGGYGGNGGLNSYSGYNNPYYQGANHVGYGYYRPGYGSIYNGVITPSLVTGYRGYTRR